MVCSFFVKHYENSARCVKLAADYVKATKATYVATNAIKKKKTFANKNDFVSCSL